MGDFPSGQRGQTVNLLATPSVVRIHHPPPKTVLRKHGGFLLRPLPARSILFIPSINKSSHGFDGQKCAHTASSPLAIRQVFPAGLFLSGRISAPTKLLAPASDVFSSDFWFLRRRLAGASQGEKGKKHRKDTLSGVVALVNRWYQPPLERSNSHEKTVPASSHAFSAF